jgi:catechol 2,3-dioxygenase-like lactoylglutathione lyase family enzyme
MIQKMSHTTIWVLDQERALRFYRDKLGLEVRKDATMEGGFRWLTLSPKGQPDLQIILMPIVEGPHMSKETVEHLRALLKQGVMGAGVFQTSDCRATYEELKAKGVTFKQGPEERFYGIEALFQDEEGNWFSMTQPSGV